MEQTFAEFIIWERTLLTIGIVTGLPSATNSEALLHMSSALLTSPEHAATFL